MGHIAFLGLGNMGLPMASRLVAAGFEVRGFDPGSAASAHAVQAGLPTASSVAAAMTGADTVISMLPSGREVIELYCTGDGAAFPLKRGMLAIDCSTIDVESCARFHAAAGQAGADALDAPVSGGTVGARDGTLTFMVGGDDPVLRRARPMLEAMGRKVVHAGPAGSGQIAKLCNNMIAGVSMLVVSEALMLAQRLGLEPKKLFEIAATSSGQCWALTSYAPLPGLVPTAPANRDYEGGFASALMLKDLRLAQQAAGASGAATPMGALAAALYALHCGQGSGRLDFSSVIRMFEFGGGK